MHLSRICNNSFWTFMDSFFASIRPLGKVHFNVYFCGDSKLTFPKLQYIDMLEKLCVDNNVALAPGIATTIKKVRNQQH